LIAFYLNSTPSPKAVRASCLRNKNPEPKPTIKLQNLLVALLLLCCIHSISVSHNQDDDIKNELKKNFTKMKSLSLIAIGILTLPPFTVNVSSTQQQQQWQCDSTLVEKRSRQWNRK
jgi:hypothetical protein